MSLNQETAILPHGLRVLLVDDNASSLKVFLTLLQECNYKVTVTTNATKALELLRESIDDYDILITDIQLPDMDGFDFLNVVVLETNIPVIVTSEDDDTETVMKSIRLGAQDFLVKPVRMNELKNIWQHVLRKELFHSPRRPSITRMEPSRKRERENGVAHGPFDEEFSAPKKPRVRWSKALKSKFISVVETLGEDAVPNKILELMNESHLTREHVSSHLQKYRNDLNKEKMKSADSNQDNLLRSDAIVGNCSYSNVTSQAEDTRLMLEEYLNLPPSMLLDLR